MPKLYHIIRIPTECPAGIDEATHFAKSVLKEMMSFPLFINDDDAVGTLAAALLSYYFERVNTVFKEVEPLIPLIPREKLIGPLEAMGEVQWLYDALENDDSLFDDRSFIKTLGDVGHLYYSLRTLLYDFRNPQEVPQ